MKGAGKMHEKLGMKWVECMRKCKHVNGDWQVMNGGNEGGRFGISQQSALTPTGSILARKAQNDGHACSSLGLKAPGRDCGISQQQVLTPTGSILASKAQNDVVRTSWTESKPDYSEFIPGDTNKISSDLFTDESIRSLPSAYNVVFKDDVYVDVSSTINDCDLHLFKKVEKKNNSTSTSPNPQIHWRNNVVVVKRKAGERDNYQDISTSDATAVIKFLCTLLHRGSYHLLIVVVFGYALR